MSLDLIPMLSYVLISTFTPGPSNISSASTSLLVGYRKTLNYQAGLAAGVFSLMFLSGWISTTLLGIFPALEPILHYAGAAYILYLAFGILKASYSFDDNQAKPLQFIHGLTLQVLNPKLIVYAFTLFSAFLDPITENLALVTMAAAILAAISFCSTSTWALFGTAIKTYLRNPRLRTVVNIVLAISLVYVAFTLTDLV